MKDLIEVNVVILSFTVSGEDFKFVYNESLLGLRVFYWCWSIKVRNRGRGDSLNPFLFIIGAEHGINKFLTIGEWM